MLGNQQRGYTHIGAVFSLYFFNNGKVVRVNGPFAALAFCDERAHLAQKLTLCLVAKMPLLQRSWHFETTSKRIAKVQSFEP